MNFTDRKVISLAISKDPEFASYCYAREIDINTSRPKLNTEVMPIAYVEMLADIQHDELKKRFPKVDESNYEDADYNVRSLFREMLRLREDIKKVKKRVRTKPNSLPALSTKLQSIFRAELGDRNWIYYNNGGSDYTPYLVKQVTYKAIESRGRDYASVDITLVNISRNSTSSNHFEITTDIFRSNGKDPYEILKSMGFTFETEELFAEYSKRYKDYLMKAQWQNKQMLYHGEKYINDNVFQMEAPKTYYNRGDIVRKMLSEFSSNSELSDVPYDMTIYAFKLGEHSFEWIKSYNATEYMYDASIEKKLILPEEHKSLIDILLSEDISEMGGDIIEGKGKGTIILAKGRAGIGKTATSEIYSEKKELPLYSVHSGQLSIDGESMEKKLKTIFTRAERWGCILLLDEADVFIRQRDNDINHNAIVASFLRTMEYYNGTLFMTTNREDDVDEAIESRCIAVLRYAMPSVDMRLKLWALFISQFEIKVATGTVEELSEKMNDLSGRDIKNISMLVSRYTQGKKIEIADFEIFKTCATFRGKYSIGD